MVDCGSITVTEPFTASRVSILSCSGVPSEGQPGGSASVTAEVENPNSTRAAGTVEVTAGGNVLGTADFNAPAGGSVTVTVPIQLPASPGDYSIQADLTNISQPVGGLSLFGGGGGEVEQEGRRSDAGRQRGD